jgi:hypothetical protein
MFGWPYLFRFDDTFSGPMAIGHAIALLRSSVNGSANPRRPSSAAPSVYSSDPYTGGDSPSRMLHNLKNARRLKSGDILSKVKITQLKIDINYRQGYKIAVSPQNRASKEAAFRFHTIPITMIHTWRGSSFLSLLVCFSVNFILPKSVEWFPRSDRFSSELDEL